MPTAPPLKKAGPQSYAAVTAPYSTYTATGTLTGGTPSVTKPQIQGPCVFYYGGSNNYYQSPNGTFTTPKLGTVSFATKADVQGNTATLSAKDSSVEGADGSVVLTIRHNGRTVAVASNGAFQATVSMLKATTDFVVDSTGDGTYGGAQGYARLTVR